MNLEQMSRSLRVFLSISGILCSKIFHAVGVDSLPGCFLRSHLQCREYTKSTWDDKRVRDPSVSSRRFQTVFVTEGDETTVLVATMNHPREAVSFLAACRT